MNLTIGDTVRFLDEQGQAVVKGFAPKGMVLIEDTEGFEYPVEAKRLVKVENPAAEHKAYRTAEEDVRDQLVRNNSGTAMKKIEKDFKLKYKNQESQNIVIKGEFMEIDLHIHELLDDETGLDPAAKRDIQMRHFERMMRIAEEKKVPRVIFIHGVGEGVLRSLIRKTLADFYPNASFHDADFRVYGQGATEVRIRQNR